MQRPDRYEESSLAQSASHALLSLLPHFHFSRRRTGGALGGWSSTMQQWGARRPQNSPGPGVHVLEFAQKHFARFIALRLSLSSVPFFFF